MSENEVTKALKDLAENKFEFVECEIEFEKKTIEEIEELSKNIDTNKAADEVIQWLVDNVSNYIDNKEKEFRIDLVIEENSGESMENIKLLQDLYRGIPDDSEYLDSEKVQDIMENGDINEILNDENLDKICACRQMLDNISFEIHDKIREPERLEKLFNAMIFFYEMIGINKGEAVLRELKGGVDIPEFMYDSFNIAVTALGTTIDISKEETEERKIMEKYLIPEGFSLMIEISFVDSSLSRGLF